MKKRTQKQKVYVCMYVKVAAGKEKSRMSHGTSSSCIHPPIHPSTRSRAQAVVPTHKHKHKHKLTQNNMSNPQTADCIVSRPHAIHFLPRDLMEFRAEQRQQEPQRPPRHRTEPPKSGLQRNCYCSRSSKQPTSRWIYTPSQQRISLSTHARRKGRTGEKGRTSQSCPIR